MGVKCVKINLKEEKKKVSLGTVIVTEVGIYQRQRNWNRCLQNRGKYESSVLNKH